MDAYVRRALANAESALEQPFVQIDVATGKIAGSTRIQAVTLSDGSFEIGWTWLAPQFRRTRLNTDAKLALLTHLFETLNAERVQLKTDDRNVVSQRAIERIGGKLDGILRHDRLTWNGHRRSSHMYSIIRSEWPEVQVRLESLLR